MTTYTVVLVCVAAMHLATAAFASMHRVLRPTQKQFAPLAGFCASQAISALGNAIVNEANDLAQATRGQQLYMLGATLGVLCFAMLAQQSTYIDVHKGVRAIQAWSVVITAAIVAGWCLGDTRRDPRAFGLSWAPDFLEARFTPLGLLLTWIVFPVSMFLLNYANRRPREPLGRAELWGTSALGTLAFWNDTLVRFGPLRSFYINEIVMLVLALAASRRIRDGLSASSDELQVRTAALALNHLELDQMNAQLQRQQQLAAVGEFAAVIAHEVRNPLAIIKNAVSALRRAQDPSHVPSLVGIVDEEVTRLQRLVSDLSTYTRPMLPTPTRVPLAPLIERVLERARTANETGREWSVEVRLAPSEAELDGDPAMIEMALGNILSNAVQAMSGRGKIRVEAEPSTDGSATALRVIDTGHGMSSQVVAKAREPFFTTRSTGTGLGLAIVDRVMRAHEGRFDIESSPRGTSVTLTFPRAQRAEPLPPTPQREEAAR